MTGALLAASTLAAVHFGSLALAGLRMRRRRVLAAPSGPAVSIVRPVCGLEPFVEATLASGFALDHPDYEILFCVERADDPVVPLVRRLIAAHPAVPARLLVGAERVNGNPKLNNCLKGWAAAKHDWIVLADSNVLMPPDYLAQLLSRWRVDTGLVCSTPLGSRPEGFAAAVECAFLNTLQARWQYAAESIGIGFAQGKSMLWRRSFLDAQGGLGALAAEIAEDAAATKLVRRAGLRVRLVDSPFEQPLGRRSLRGVWDRQLRWARLRRVTFPAFFAPEIVTGAAAPLLLGCVALGPVAVLLLLPWYAAEALLAWRKGWALSWRVVLGFVARDAMIPAMWVMGWTTGSTVWRGNTLPLGGAASQPAHPKNQ